MEKRLIKQGRVEEFNSQFRDTVERGVFRELSEEELRVWKGPFNYIAMVEAFKNGPHATKPLCICMNSSLKQPPPVKKSLNDCLMKGSIDMPTPKTFPNFTRGWRQTIWPNT
jgi:hypothetical protein